MPFPLDLESLLAAGYTFARSEICPVCQEAVEVFTTPGKREIALNPMCELLRPAVRHYETCNVTPKQEATNGSTGNDVQDAQGRDSDGGPDGTAGGPDNDGQLRHGETRISVGRLDAGSAGIKLYGVTDPNRQLLAVGWDDGVLVCQFKTAKWSYAGVPESEFVKLRRVPYAYRIFTTNIKGKYPATKLE